MKPKMYELLNLLVKQGIMSGLDYCEYEKNKYPKELLSEYINDWVMIELDSYFHFENYEDEE